MAKNEIQLGFGNLSAGESGVALRFPPQSKIGSRNDQALFQSEPRGDGDSAFAQCDGRKHREMRGNLKKLR